MKILIYCTKAKPWLCINSGTFFGSNNPYELAGAREKLSVHLNGTVCFECEIEKAEEIENTLLHMAPTFMHETKTLCDSELLRRACLTPEEADEYMPKHALYLTNVKEIKPFKITELWKYKAHPFGPYHLSRAPQNMCWAWAWNDEERKWERVLVLSLRPKNLCNIANGLKDIETRRQVVNEIKEMEK